MQKPRGAMEGAATRRNRWPVDPHTRGVGAEAEARPGLQCRGKETSARAERRPIVPHCIRKGLP